MERLPEGPGLSESPFIDSSSLRSADVEPHGTRIDRAFDDEREYDRNRRKPIHTETRGQRILHALAAAAFELEGNAGAFAAATLVFGLAYFQNFRTLITTWREDQNYSHGFLVIPIAVWILWQRLAGVKPDPSAGAVPAPWWGWVFLTAVLAVRAFAYEWNSQGLENVTILLAIACLTWTFGGWPLLHRSWPAIAYLVFMLPLPPTINNLVAMPLQLIATTGSRFLLQLSGFWAIQEGNVINLKTPSGMMPLDVALACNGLRMMMTMVATAMAIIILVPLPIWKRIVLLVSIVPIALLSNILRITATGWCYYLFHRASCQGVGPRRVRLVDDARWRWPWWGSSSASWPGWFPPWIRPPPKTISQCSS